MYIEWNPENLDVKPLCLYYLQLYILKTQQEYFFSKGNITSAREILEKSKKYQFNPYFYIYLNFITKERDINYGFRFMNSKSYLFNFLKLLEKKEHIKFNVPQPLYNVIKADLKKINMQNIQKSIKNLIDLYVKQQLNIYTLLYLIVIFNLKNVIKTEKIKAKLDNLFLIIERGVIPKDIKNFSYQNFEGYCNSVQELIY